MHALVENGPVLDSRLVVQVPNFLAHGRKPSRAVLHNKCVAFDVEELLPRESFTILQANWQVKCVLTQYFFRFSPSICLFPCK